MKLIAILVGLLVWGSVMANGSVITAGGIWIANANPDRNTENGGGQYYWLIDDTEGNPPPVSAGVQERNALATDPDNKTFVVTPVRWDVDGSTVIGGRVRKYSSGGVLVWEDFSTGGRFYGVAIDPQDKSIVVVGTADEHGHTMYKYTSAGQLLWSKACHQNPRAVAVHPTDSSIFVSGLGGPPQKYDADGDIVFTADEDVDYDPLDDYHGIAVHTDGKFVVAVWRSAVDARPGVIGYTAAGVIDWEDPNINAVTVAIDYIDGSVYAGAAGYTSFSVPAVRKYNSAGGVVWSWNDNHHITKLVVDPHDQSIVMTGQFNLTTTPQFFVVRQESNGDIASAWGYGLFFAVTVGVGAAPVVHPSNARIGTLSATSAELIWEPPG